MKAALLFLALAVASCSPSVKPTPAAPKPIEQVSSPTATAIANDLAAKGWVLKERLVGDMLLATDEHVMGEGLHFEHGSLQSTWGGLSGFEIWLVPRAKGKRIAASASFSYPINVFGANSRQIAYLMGLLPSDADWRPTEDTLRVKFGFKKVPPEEIERR